MAIQEVLGGAGKLEVGNFTFDFVVPLHRNAISSDSPWEYTSGRLY